MNLSRTRLEIDAVERERTAEALGYGDGAEQLGGAGAVMGAHVFERGFASFERAVELMVLDVFQNFLEARPRRESQPLQVLAANQPRRTNLGSGHRRHRAATKMPE